MKYVLLAACVIGYNMAIAQMTNGAVSYSGTCRDVGHNDNGQNTLTNCTSGVISGAGCSFITQGVHVIIVRCDDSQYVYSCGGASVTGKWYKTQQNTYKCMN